MAKTKQRLFIYDRKEMSVLILLGLMVALFAFTLGIHLGKRVNPPSVALSHESDTHSAGTTTDKVPEPSDLTEQAKGALNAADDVVTQALRDEVEKTGLKLSQPRQVDLPKNPKSASAGSTSSEETPKVEEKPKAESAPAEGKFTLQVGSHPNIQEAKEQLEQLQTQGLRAFIRSADLKSKGLWHRVYVGGYETKEAAEKAGLGFREKKLIGTYFVTKNAP